MHVIVIFTYRYMWYVSYDCFYYDNQVLHVSGQIDLVRRKLSEISKKDIERHIAENIIKTLIVRHQNIIIFSKNIEALFSNIALMQFISNTLVICCLGFLIVIVSNLI